MEVQDIYNPRWSDDNFRKAKEMVDFGLSISRQNESRYMEISKVYRAYHEQYSKKELEEMTNVHGKVSSTPMVMYFKPKTKIDQLLGESLEVGFSAEVDTVNPTELQKKKKKYLRNLGRSASRHLIDGVRNQGFNIYQGVKIPSIDDPSLKDPSLYRTRNELISQRIMNEKIKDLVEKNLYYDLFGSQLFSSEIFSMITTDRNGHTTIKFIPPERMIFIDNASDPHLLETPIIGYWENMYFPQIVERFKLKPTQKEYNELKVLFGNINTATNSSMKYYNLLDTQENQVISSINQPVIKAGNGLMATVFYFQWRYYEDTYIYHGSGGEVRIMNMKRSRDRKLVKQFPDRFEKVISEKIYQGASVAGTVYLGFDDVENPIRIPDAFGGFRAYYDFNCSLNRTFGNKRTGFAKVLVELGKEYNKARWMLMREARKLRSNAIYINRAYMDTRSQNSILYALEDAGIVEVNTKAAEEEMDESISDGRRMVGSVASGSTGSVVVDLINICLNLENAIDKATGMNDARNGVEKATTTATTNTNNLQASRSITFDNFYFAENHIQRALSSLIQKTKGAIALGSMEARFYLSEDDLSYIEQSADFIMDDFKARVVGGRSHQSIVNDLTQLLTNEVAAGKRTSTDYAKIRQQSSLQEIVNILEESDKRMNEIESANQQNAIQAQNQGKQELQKQANEAREDQQAHEVKLQEMKDNTEIQKAQIAASAQQGKNIDSLLQKQAQELFANLKKQNEKKND